MASKSPTPVVPDSFTRQGYGLPQSSQADISNIGSTGAADFANGSATDPIHNGNSATGIHDGSVFDSPMIDRSASAASNPAGRESAGAGIPSRSNTLKKKTDLNRKTSLKRSSSRKSLKAGSIKGVAFGDSVQERDYNSAFHTPIPTQGSPTEILANRFQAWRSFLKSLITYFREVQASYDHRSKALMKVSNVISNTTAPSAFITDGGLADATRILNDYHKHALAEANKSKDIEQDVISALSGLRADLGSKIKEIKGLAGDFKNTVDKEKDNTKKAVTALEDALQHYDHTDGGMDKGGNDPFLARLAVDRSIERQIDEENYLHRAYLNLESSGRELEAIVVGEVQKAYNALAGILRREGDDALAAVEALRTGPIGISKDAEWNQFVTTDPHFVNPKLPLRKVQEIEYPGKFHPAAADIRSGMLERKSKYLKSYTPGWYVLSPTHLHEFKSADNIYSQPPVMSLYLGDQKLGSSSSADSSSHKFMLKGRQSGGMHRSSGHQWVFRAESYDTMLAWMDAIRSLTEKTGAERTEYVRQHARSVSGTSTAPALSISSDGMEEDEADQVPYAASVVSVASPPEEMKPQRPLPGGRFPSDLNVPRTDGPLSDNSSEPETETVAAAAALPGSNFLNPESAQQRAPVMQRYETNPYQLEGIATREVEPHSQEQAAMNASLPVSTTGPASNAQVTQQQPAVPTQTFVLPVQTQAPTNQVQPQQSEMQAGSRQIPEPVRHNSMYGDWMSPAATGAVAGIGAGVLGDEAYRRHHQQQNQARVTETIAEGGPAGTHQLYDGTTFVPDGISTEPSSSISQSTAPTSVTSSLGGLESVGAHPTGQIFPRVLRHDTDMSVNQLHVPGEFPKVAGSPVEGASPATGLPQAREPSAWEKATALENPVTSASPARLGGEGVKRSI